MSSPQAQCETLKSTICSGNATPSTVTTLQSLLSADAKTTTTTKSNKTTTASTTAARRAPATTNKSNSKASTKASSVDIHKDESRSLAPKERYALATEVVNGTLKVLSEKCRSRARQHKARSTFESDSSLPATPRKLGRTPSSISQRVLQPRSGNSTPSTATPSKPHGATVKPTVEAPTNSTSETTHLRATGECSRLAFSFLRSANTKQLGVRDLPKFQLENGMLALAGKLLANGLDSLAIKELRIVKGKLESAGQAKSSGAPEKETLAGLLQLNLDFANQSDALPLAIAYQSLVLRIIASSSKPATIEACIEHLDLSLATSPANLIKRQAEVSGDDAKAGRLIETLSTTILGMCPSLSSRQDAIAINREVSPAPEAVYQLQSIGLQLRKEWWALVQHQADVEKELLEPFSRCLCAFIRRTSKRTSAKQIYVLANRNVKELISNCEAADSKALLVLRRTLSSLAEEAGRTEDATEWSNALTKQCEGLESNHAQRVAGVAKRVLTSDMKVSIASLLELNQGLREKLAGNHTDLEYLLTELARLLARVSTDSENKEELHKLSALSASFALRFTRSYPGQGLAAAQIIIHHALRKAGSTDAPIAWINGETIQTLIDAGALDEVVLESASKAAGHEWDASPAAMTLARALHFLIIRALKSSLQGASASTFDNEHLNNLQRGLVLERQLSVAFEQASRSKYHAVLKNVLPEIIQKLLGVYLPREHPLRRAIVATRVLQLSVEHPNIIPAHLLKACNDTTFQEKALYNDEGLKKYTSSIDAELRLAKILHAGNPSFVELEPLLLIYQATLDNAADEAALEDQVPDPIAVRSSLTSISAFFGSLGDDAYCLRVVQMIEKLDGLLKSSLTESIECSVRGAKQWLSLGFSEQAGIVSARSEKHMASESVPVLSKIQWHLAYAEYLLAIDNLDKCKSTLGALKELRDELPPKGVSKDQRAAYERAHGEGWLLQSKYNLARGAPHDALAAAKHAMKIVNSAWCRLEKGQASDVSQSKEDRTEPQESDIAGLSAGVSKLKFSPKGSSDDRAKTDIKGAAFWPLVPLLSHALAHLSDLYAHHGLYPEANYYSEKAVETAGSVGPTALLSRMKSRRAILLVQAGSVEEAELCLVGSEDATLAGSPLATVDRFQAQAAVHTKEGSIEEAIRSLNEASQLIADMQSEQFVTRLSRFEDPSTENKKLSSKPVKPAPAAKTMRSTARTRKTAGTSTTASAKPPARSSKPTNTSSYLLQKWQALILMEKAILDARPCKDEKALLESLAPLKYGVVGTLKQRRVQYGQLMAKATAALQTDIAYNILLDSTLSFPALWRPDTNGDTAQETQPTKKAAPKTNNRAGQRKTVAKASFKDMLQEARACLLTGHSAIAQYSTSAEVHSEGGHLLDVTTLCSSIDLTSQSGSLSPFQAGLDLDFPRINALTFEQQAALVDSSHEHRATPFEWPSMSSEPAKPQLSAAEFQQDYINIIPQPWTAVSLYLDESCTSLYVARYRANQSPFIVRLPFSRHQDEEIGDEAFDYAAGKEELQDIIQLSNASCHSVDLSAKGAKSGWWKEREALDRRLQELLINIEDIWFGGFKGVFAPRARNPALLARFRASFEAALDRHLPSRQASKSRGPKLSLDNNALELFVNLGSDNDGTIDLDEPISDLLYFVVDMLQFNGERNAYDEVDFDEMTVEVLDALRSYHEAIDFEDGKDQHVVLVLDKRLQAFPWENLPCLEGVSVSRVGSMLSLRDCITAMRGSANNETRHAVSKKSGAFILNPSSDLTSTQKTLEPALAKAASLEDAKWTSIVDRAPTEDDFKTTLENSAMTLYFGHGAGSQYIRPRAIKKLEKCSEVVWLMGCSSGAVTEHGELEPQAVPLAYLNAGRKATAESAESAEKEPEENSKCLSVVATLWDVTDKDIDRFSLTVGEEWGLWPPSTETTALPSKTPKKRERLVAPSTPQQAPKTPKTPKVKKTPAAAKTPARSRSRSKARGESGQASLAAAVAQSRDACYLRFLNGAAPVVYGVPVHLGD